MDWNKTVDESACVISCLHYARRTRCRRIGQRPTICVGRVQTLCRRDVFHSTDDKSVLRARERHGRTGRANCNTALRLGGPWDGAIELYITSPHSAIGVPPSVALMGRLLTTRLPVVDEQLKPRDHQDSQVQPRSEIHMQTLLRQTSWCAWVITTANRRSGSPETRKKQKQWSLPSTAVRRDPINRSYIVQTGACVNYRRNRRHIQCVPVVDPYVGVDFEPDDGPVETADIPAEPGVQPEPAVQVAPIAPPVKHTRCGRLIRPPVRFDQLPDWRD